jgi:hypothetical protein
MNFFSLVHENGPTPGKKFPSDLSPPKFCFGGKLISIDETEPFYQDEKVSVFKYACSSAAHEAQFLRKEDLQLYSTNIRAEAPRRTTNALHMWLFFGRTWEIQSPQALIR